MKKSLIALAVSSAFVAGAAQADAEVYGRLDVGLGNGVGMNANSIEFYADNIATSELGFRAANPLGDTGLTGHLQVGGSIAGRSAGPDDPTTLDEIEHPSTGVGRGGFSLDRHKVAGISGDFGKFEAGQFLNPAYTFYSSTHPNGGNSVAVAGLAPTTVMTTWVSNALAYTTPNLNGLSAKVMYSPDGNSPSNELEDLLGLSVAYSQGPMRVGVGYQSIGDSNVINDVDQGNTMMVVGGTYDLGALRLGANFVNADDDVDVYDGDNNSIMVGAKYSVNADTSVGASVTRHGTGSTLMNLQAHRQLGDMITLYAMVSRADNDEGDGGVPAANYRTFWGDATSAAAAGEAETGFTVGMITYF